MIIVARDSGLLQEMDLINLNQFDGSDNRPLYKRVEDYIESLVYGGAVKPGEPIPSLAQLTKVLGVNTLTVRRAIRELTFKRVLVTLQGRGTFVADGAIKRVLWVSGQNLFRGDVSPYYTDLFRHAAEDCERHLLNLEPVWLEEDRPFDMVLNANGGEAAILGYIFSGCKPNHRLLNHVINRGRPFVNVSATHFGKPRCVLPNFIQGDELAIEHLRKQGIENIYILSIRPIAEDLLTRLREQGVQVEVVTLLNFAATGSAKKARVEEQGYFWARQLAASSGFEGQGLYVADDIAARGITRAILETGTTKPVDIVIQSNREDIIPLGIPVTYVVYDIAELAGETVKMLVAQIQGQETTLQYYCSFQLLLATELLEEVPMHLSASLVA